MRSLVAVMLLLTGTARAEQACFLSYAGFEEKVPHLDLDACMVRQAVKIGGIQGLALTKLDVLDGMAELKICTSYRVKGQVMQRLPSAMEAQAAAEPIYEVLEGWSGSTRGARSYAQLPAAAVKYVRRIEELVEAPVVLLSTSPDRDDTITLRDPFAG